MADVKISGLPAASSAAGAMELEVNDAGSSKKVTVNQLQDKTIGTSNGLIARTGVNAVEARTITAGGGAVVSNGNGVSGNPTVAADFASQAEAEAGASSAKVMSPLRSKQLIDALSGTSGAGKLLKLDGSGRLPAVDGSQLTNLPASPALGVGQTWQTVTRSTGTSYQNTTGKPIMVAFYQSIGSTPTDSSIQVSVNNSSWITVLNSRASSAYNFGAVVVPDGYYYRIQSGSGNPLTASELR